MARTMMYRLTIKHRQGRATLLVRARNRAEARALAGGLPVVRCTEVRS